MTLTGLFSQRVAQRLPLSLLFEALLLDGPRLNPSSKSLHGSPTSLLSGSYCWHGNNIVSFSFPYAPAVLLQYFLYRKGVYLIELSRRSRGSNKCECGQLNRCGWLERDKCRKEGGLASARIHHLMVFGNCTRISSFYIIVKEKPSNFNDRKFQSTRLSMEVL